MAGGMKGTPQRRPAPSPGKGRQSRSPSPSPSPPRRAAGGNGARTKTMVVAAMFVAAAAAGWWQLQLRGQRWPHSVSSALRSEPRVPLAVEEWVPPRSVSQSDAGSLSAAHVLAHLRIDEGSAGTRANEESAPLVMRRPLPAPPAPTATPDQASGASRGVVILANGRDAKVRSKCYALITVIRELFLDPIPVAVFHLGRAESFSPAAVGALAALGNVTVADLGVSTGLPATPRWRGGPGFLSKPRAAIAGLSRWQSVLLLDADSVLFQPPSAFFELVSFRQTGLALWRDYHPCFTSLSPYLLQRMQINSSAFCAATRRQESDSSVIVVGGQVGHSVHDSRCTAAAAVALCEHGCGRKDEGSRGELHAQKLMLGDKDSWAIGAALCGMGVESSVSSHPPGALALHQPTQRNLGSSSNPVSARGVTTAVFNGQVQFDDAGQPLYWNGNGQSASELLRALDLAEAPATSDGQRATTEAPGHSESVSWSLQYVHNLPSLKLKSARASDMYSDKSKHSSMKEVERAEETPMIIKVSRGKVLPTPPAVVQALRAAAEAIAKASTMDGISTGPGENSIDGDVATEDVFQVVTTMMQHGQRLQHAKRGGSALLELDRAASLACAKTEKSMPTPSDAHGEGQAVVQNQLTQQSDLLALCATATYTFAGSLCTHGNAAAAGRAYRKVVSLVEQYKAAMRDNTSSDNSDRNIELPDEVDVMLRLADCITNQSGRGGHGSAEDVSEALSVIQTVLQIEPSSVAGRLQHGTLLLYNASSAHGSSGASTTQGYETGASRQQAALDEFESAIALSEADGAAPCAAAHLKRGQLLESWLADTKAAPRTAEAHKSYAAVLKLSPQDEEGLAGFERTAAAATAGAPSVQGDRTAAQPTLSRRAPSDDESDPQRSLCAPGEEELRPSATTNSTGNRVVCVACAAGQFDHDRNSTTSCVPCRPGYDSPARSIICWALRSRCDPGHEEKLPPAALASLAANGARAKGKGLFRNHQGLQLGMQAVTGQQQLACVACRDGTFDHDRSASTQCVKCKQGMYSPTGSTVCVGPSRVTSIVRNMAAVDQPINLSRLRRTP